MKHLKRIPRVGVLVFAIFSIGAKSESCQPSGSQSNQSTNQNTSTKPWCHTDPPIFCAAYCGDYDVIVLNDRCFDLGMDVQVVEFAERVDALYQDRVDLGEHLCTGYDPYNYVTPCQVFITPQEHPNQDHEVCEPVPPGCPMP